MEVPNGKKDSTTKATPKLKDNKRAVPILGFSGPDPATAELLKDNKDAWAEEHSLFWTQKTGPETIETTNGVQSIVLSCLSLEKDDAHSRITRRYHCVVLARLAAADKKIVVKKVASSIHDIGFHRSRSLEDLEKVINGYIRIGHKYDALAHELGNGILFLLGKDIPDNWSV